MPVRLIGVAIGVKNDGGMLDLVLREVEIECLPADIPSHIDVDVTNLGMHQAIRVADLPHSGSIKFLDAEDATVAHVVSIRAEAEPVAAVPAVAEPEVAKKGKTDAPAADRQEVRAGIGRTSTSAGVNLFWPVSGGGIGQPRHGVFLDAA